MQQMGGGVCSTWAVQQTGAGALFCRNRSLTSESVRASQASLKLSPTTAMGIAMIITPAIMAIDVSILPAAVWGETVARLAGRGEEQSATHAVIVVAAGCSV